jgi:hypothetical protein
VTFFSLLITVLGLKLVTAYKLARDLRMGTPELVKDPDSEKSQRAMAAMLQMKKLDIEEMKRAYAG